MSVLPEKVVECFNTGSLIPLAGLCHRWMTVYGSLFVAPPRPTSLLYEEPLGTLITAFRTVFPDLRIAAENIEESASDCTFAWRGTGTYTDPDDGKRAVVELRGDGRVRLEKDTIKDLWFTTDDYGVLLQIGRICADPGKAIGRAEELNGAALAALVRAIETGQALEDAWREISVNALLKTFADLGKGFDTIDQRYEGQGNVQALVARIREALPLPIRVTAGEPMSQGGTTSFRCRISGSDKRNYTMCCSFSSDSASVRFLRLAIAPPGKLKEMFT